ncbi:hypothetical protein JYQ62_02740 [Nostoc sp. UHCC 0702]|nr:hypothetical protein JYQ62_02740 [Nostoc sp. UHCC 0702]
MRNVAEQFGISSASVFMALNILDYLYEEEKQDYENSSYSELVKDFLENCMDFSDQSTETNKKLQELHIRFYARLTSYLTTIYQLEENLENIFKEWTRYHHSNKSKQNAIDKAIREREEEIVKYKVWRNKVFAHLEKKDSQDIKIEARLQYGGFIKDISKKECLSLQPNPSLKIFSEIDIVTQHKTLLQHYEKWENMFNEYSLE